MTVVADTSPLNYLILIGEVDLLPRLYEGVLIPNAVFEELDDPRTPALVREWLASPPSWLQLRSVQVFSKPTILHLGRGEAEAISLAIELGIRNVLIDEKLARYEAKERKLLVSGTLGILAQASRLGSCDLRSAISRLKKTNFRASPAVYAEFLRRNP